jgi:hypothetical protein
MLANKRDRELGRPRVQAPARKELNDTPFQLAPMRPGAGLTQVTGFPGASERVSVPVFGSNGSLTDRPNRRRLL